MIGAQVRELQWQKQQLEQRCLQLGCAIDDLSEKLAAAMAKIEALEGAMASASSVD